MAESTRVMVDFRTEPSRYRHWKLSIDGRVATLAMDVDEAGGLDYEPPGEGVLSHERPPPRDALHSDFCKPARSDCYRAHPSSASG